MRLFYLLLYMLVKDSYLRPFSPIGLKPLRCTPSFKALDPPLVKGEGGAAHYVINF